MGVLLGKAERVRRRAMPVGLSIEWKPLRDSHYVIASLSPGGGGLRRIFTRQSTLRDVQALARRSPEELVVGLLLGERLDCALTLTPYVLIESHVGVPLVWFDERAVADTIRTLSGNLRRRHSGQVLGWYCISRSADAALSRTHAAVHKACFAEPWQTALIVGPGGNTGAFFLHDSRTARWFHAPFYEVTDSKVGSRAPKPTCVVWPAYLTTAPVTMLVEPPQEVRPPSSRAFAAAPVSAPVRQPSAASTRPVVRTRRTPARDAIVGVGRAAVAARRSALDLAKALAGPAVTASRHATERIARIRTERAAKAAQRKAEADAARAREEERQAKLAAERRAAREEAQRRAAEAERQRAAEAEARRVAEAEARRRAVEEAERRRAAEAEAKREAAEAEARRRAEIAEARRAAEAEARHKAAEEAQRKAAEAEARRKAAEEAQRKAAEEQQRRAAEAEARRQAAEAEARRQAAEAEAQRLAKAEAEARRQAEEAEARRLAEAEAQRVAAEAEARRLAEEAEAEAQRKAAEAEEDARRKAREAEEAARRTATEAEALRISVEVAALRERLARPPVEGPKRAASRVAASWMADAEDTAASDGPYRYLALARREGFELSEKIERGSEAHPETVWLMHERESGLRLIIVTTDVAVREASLHYNLRTADDSLLRVTAPEHRDLESRTIYGREACLHDLRARCRRLRATGALEREWKVSPPTLQHAVSPR